MSAAVTIEERRIAALDAKLRRDRRRDAGVCINADSHGIATHGKLCARCRETHAKSRGVGGYYYHPDAVERMRARLFTTCAAITPLEAS